MDQTIKRFEKLAVVLVILAVLTTLLSPITQLIAGRIMSTDEYRSFTLETHAIRWMQAIVTYIVQVVLGVWLFLTAKRAGQAKWIWALFALTFGLAAVILYFLFDLLDQPKRKNDSEPAAAGNGSTRA